MASRPKKSRKKTVAENPGHSFDDALALLLQIEAGNVEDFKKLSSILGAAIKGDSLDENTANLVHAAKGQVDLFIAGELSDPEDVLVEAFRLLESASNTREVRILHKPSSIDSEASNEAATAAATSAKNTAESKVAPAQPQSAPPNRAQDKAAPESLPPDADPDLLAEFIQESRELLEKSESALLALESNPEDAESVNTVFRAFHTIKGTSGFLGLKTISELAHLAESLLSRIRNKEIQLMGGYADLALRSLDMLKKSVSAVDAALRGASFETPAGFEDLKAILANPEAAGISEDLRQEMSAQSEDQEFQSTGIEDAEAKQESIPEDPGMVQPSAPAAKAAPKKAVIPQRDTEYESSIRVNTARLDRLIDMVGELVIAQSMVVQDRRLLEESCHELSRKVTHANKIVRELQDLSMSMRMVPLRGTFQKMQRVARDLAKKSGKSVDLVTDDGETEIDRHMVDILNNVLVHMVRNAIDHGIEAPDERQASGKPPTGTVRLTAFHSGGSVVVEIRDDGRGLNREKILRKAISAGMVDPEKTLIDNEVFNLIFAPGLSTSEKVTDVSGRGVGMDVVRKGVETLHGRIDINTAPGVGSTFTVRLPLTLAITDGMLVRVGSERYIIPTISIHLCFRPEPESISTVSGRGELVMLRGDMMPIFRLHRLFGIDNAIEDPAQALLVVVGDEERRCALLVDELLGQQQVVAKSLTKAVGKVPGVSGGAILGDGQVGLILDTGEVAAQARQSSSPYGIAGHYGRPAA
jgi:two-component system, chemotaxis family, sensor kinase CheA